MHVPDQKVVIPSVAWCALVLSVGGLLSDRTRDQSPGLGNADLRFLSNSIVGAPEGGRCAVASSSIASAFQNPEIFCLYLDRTGCFSACSRIVND